MRVGVTTGDAVFVAVASVVGVMLGSALAVASGVAVSVGCGFDVEDAAGVALASGSDVAVVSGERGGDGLGEGVRGGGDDREYCGVPVERRGSPGSSALGKTFMIPKATSAKAPARTAPMANPDMKPMIVNGGSSSMGRLEV